MAGEKILIADDEPYLIRSLSFVLQKEGYQIDSASDGLEALEKVSRLRPELLILDLELPKVDGFEVCRRIKEDPKLRETYVIVLTARGQIYDRRKGLDSGADDYLTKPFSHKELVAQLRKLFPS